MSDNELGTFLRTHREAVTPAEVGLPEGGRRRTPGLRRSEVAMLAGISVEYLTRLEQGRDRHPSGQVLFALADALRLSPDERHMFALAAQASGGEECSPPDAPTRSVRDSVRALLDRLEPTPAVVVNRLSDVLAFTDGYQRLFGPVGLLETQSPNLIRFVFTDARARTAYPDWDRIADQLVAGLKTDTSRNDAYATEFANHLASSAGASFSDRLAAPPTLPARTGSERLEHPDAGELRLAYETLTLSDGEQRIVVYLPADHATSAAFDHLVRSAPTGSLRSRSPDGRQPGVLRAVSG